MIEAKIVADSMAPSGVRLTTFVLTYPRFLHSEFMTHRMFSRNASSSRAIPVKKQIQMVIDNPAIPIAFTKNQKGMQGGKALDKILHDQAVEAWLRARDQAVIQAKVLSDLEVHKQYANRILEPWAHITVVCTATDYDNFFALRIHSAALPEICELASQMHKLYSENQPTNLKNGEWHTPFMDSQSRAILLASDLAVKKLENFDESFFNEHEELVLKCSVARCARVSYLTHEGKEPLVSDDVTLYNRLVGASPIHASPAEHQAMAISDPNVRSGNFRGWIQYRKTLKDENVTNYVSTPNL